VSLSTDLESARAALATLQAEREEEARRRVLPAPSLEEKREERRLELERIIAQAEGRPYALQVEIEPRIGQEWYLRASVGRIVLLCGDPGTGKAARFDFTGVTEHRLRALSDEGGGHALDGSGLGEYGLFRVVGGDSRFVLREREHELDCFAERVEAAWVDEDVLALRAT
jgi:hypothetical protein